MQSYQEFRQGPLHEATASGRYSVEVNYRTGLSEAMEAFAKICLGFVSASLKDFDLHVKQVYEERPIRIMVSSRNWDDGEWVVCVSWNPKLVGFVVSKGFWKKGTRSMAAISNVRCTGTDAAAIVKEVRALMLALKDKKDRHQEKLKPVPLKRGPK